MTLITSSNLQKIFPRNHNIAAWVDPLNSILSNYDINTKERVAGFLAQCGHESGEFKILVENLNYSSKGLLTVFKKYFTPEQAEQYARKPEMIGNRVYANRMGNSDETSGDGFKYRGRGILQVTGKENYTSCSFFLYEDNRLALHPELLEQPLDAIKSACWFWTKNNLNVWCDKKDIVTLTKRINGGTNGLEDRIKKFDLAMSIL